MPSKEYFILVKGRIMPIKGCILAINGLIIPIEGRIMAIDGLIMPIEGRIMVIDGRIMPVRGYILSPKANTISTKTINYNQITNIYPIRSTASSRTKVKNPNPFNIMSPSIGVLRTAGASGLGLMIYHGRCPWLPTCRPSGAILVFPLPIAD
jgi:hypothetical protein